jgi:predicted esterase
MRWTATRRIGPILLSAALLSCGLSPFGGNDDTWSSTIAYSKSLSGVVRLPADLDPARQYPLLVVLHGYGGTAEGFATAFDAYAGEDIFLAAPQGPVAAAGAWSWYLATDDRSLWPASDGATVAGVVEMIRDVQSRYRVGKVFVLGFSQGVMMAYMVGLLNPTLVTGVVAVAGAMPEVDQEGSIVHAADITAARDVKLSITRGAMDAAVDRSFYTAQRDFFTNNQYDVTAYEFIGVHTIPAEVLDRVLPWLKANAAP